MDLKSDVLCMQLEILLDDMNKIVEDIRVLEVFLSEEFQKTRSASSGTILPKD